MNQTQLKEDLARAWKIELLKRFEGSTPRDEYYARPEDAVEMASRTVAKMMASMSEHYFGALSRNPALKAAARSVGITRAAHWNALWRTQ